MPKPSHRDTLIQSGLAVFHEHGFHATGVQSIVDHAGVPKGSFYNHFKSKDELGVEILNYYWNVYSDARDALRDPGTPALERIDRHLSAFGDSPFGCLVGNFSIEMFNVESFRSTLEMLYSSWITDIAYCIEEGQRRGNIRADDTAENLAEFVVTSLQGTILKTKIDRDSESLTRLRNSMTRYLKQD